VEPITKREDPVVWYKSAQFVILLAMLVSFIVLVVLVLWIPIPRESGDGTTLKDILDFRSAILTTIVSAFSAWIGAGAAYYFSTEQTKRIIEGLRGQPPGPGAPTPPENLKQ